MMLAKYAIGWSFRTALLSLADDGLGRAADGNIVEVMSSFGRWQLSTFPVKDCRAFEAQSDDPLGPMVMQAVLAMPQFIGFELDVKGKGYAVRSTPDAISLRIFSQSSGFSCA